MTSYRLLVLSIVGAVVVLGGFLVYGNLNNNLVYYLTPAEAVEQKADLGTGERFRLGGFVQDDSVTRTESGVTFSVESDGVEIPVVHTGVPSQLFGPGIGVVVEGSWQDSTFRSDTLIVKHDENYRPPDSDKAESSSEGEAP